MAVVTRAQWGAAPPKSKTPLVPSGLEGIAVHYTGMNADEQADHKNCAARVKGIQNYHMNSNGWADIAYSFVVCKHGYVFEGRGWGWRTAAQGTNDGNDAYHAVCFLGDDTDQRDDLTDAGRSALVTVIRSGQVRYPHALEVKPHSAFHATGCPGNELRLWIAAKPWIIAPSGHSPPWQLKVGTKIIAKGRLGNPLFRAKVTKALKKHGKVTLRDEP